MLALKLVRLIEDHSEELAMGLTVQLQWPTRDFWCSPPRRSAWQRPRFTTTWESGCCRRQKPISRSKIERLGERRAAEGVGLHQFAPALDDQPQPSVAVPSAGGFRDNVIQLSGKLELQQM